MRRAFLPSPKHALDSLEEPQISPLLDSNSLGSTINKGCKVQLPSLNLCQPNPPFLQPWALLRCLHSTSKRQLLLRTGLWIPPRTKQLSWRLKSKKMLMKIQTPSVHLWLDTIQHPPLEVVAPITNLLHLQIRISLLIIALTLTWSQPREVKWVFKTIQLSKLLRAFQLLQMLLPSRDLPLILKSRRIAPSERVQRLAVAMA